MTDIPSSSETIQIEPVLAGKPDSEAIMQAIGAAVNYALKNMAKVGDVVASDLDETNFQAERDATWWLCDGRSCVGTRYQLLTGRATIPDRRGTVLRMKDNGRGLDPHGDLAVGTYEGDQFASHAHAVNASVLIFTSGPPVAGGAVYDVQPVAVSGSTGGSETNAKGSITNFFVKVDT